MKFHYTAIPDAVVIELEPIHDERGFFCRTFCAEELASRGLISEVIQVNCSHCKLKGTLRGLHYQIPPWEEAKILRCVRGAVQDVIVDLRKDSPTFLSWHSQVLRDDDFMMIYVPPGFAHGYMALQANSEVNYSSSARYAPEFERQVRFNDPRLAIKWLIADPIVSNKDASAALIGDVFEGV